jgi:hypothetical protein
MRYAFLQICNASIDKEVVKRAIADRQGEKEQQQEEEEEEEKIIIRKNDS